MESTLKSVNVYNSVDDGVMAPCPYVGNNLLALTLHSLETWN